MEPRPIRMPDELWDAIEEDAREHNRMAAEHVREICREYLQADTTNVHKRLDELEERIERLEAGRGGDGVSRADSSGSNAETESESESEPGSETAPDVEDPAPVESIDDVLAEVRYEHGEDETQQAAGRAVLEALREDERVSRDDLRRALFEEYASDAESAEVWWSTTVQPVLRVAARWGLIVVHDDEFEWIGPPEISA